MPRSKTRARIRAANSPSHGSGWTPKRLGQMSRTVHKRLIAFTQSLEYKRGVEAAQQKSPRPCDRGLCWFSR